MRGENVGWSYLQLEVDERFALPLASGSRLVVFQCRDHGDVARIDEYFDLESEQQLPGGYWDLLAPLNCLRLFPPGTELASSDEEPLLQAAGIEFHAAEDADGRQALKVGGTPSWAQGPPELRRCACGAPLIFLVQVPEDYEFPTTDGAPEQQDTYCDTEYKMFIGNEVYFLACEAACDPRAVWPVVQ